MRTHAASQAELHRLLKLTHRAGNDPLLTQASTGNSSVKLDGVLWIKASGRWMADALSDDILVPLDLSSVKECVQSGVDPSERYPGASLETAMHATLPHRLVLHVHCVNTIAWAVRNDAPILLRELLEGLSWQWIPYRASGLPLSRTIEQALSVSSNTSVFILGNHGLVIAAEDAEGVENLLAEVRARLAIAPRVSPPADYAALREIVQGSLWKMPDDDEVHALATDSISRTILAAGLFHPCQAILSPSRSAETFRAIPYREFAGNGQAQRRDQPFLSISGCGVVMRRSTTPAEVAMVSGLAQVVRRLSASAPVHYLTDSEIGGISAQAAWRYKESTSQRESGR